MPVARRSHPPPPPTVRKWRGSLPICGPATRAIYSHRRFTPRSVQERFGHSSVAITMDIYSHLMPNIQERRRRGC